MRALGFVGCVLGLVVAAGQGCARTPAPTPEPRPATSRAPAVDASDPADACSCEGGDDASAPTPFKDAAAARDAGRIKHVAPPRHGRHWFCGATYCNESGECWGPSPPNCIP